MSYIKRWLESLSDDPEGLRRRLLAAGEPYPFAAPPRPDVPPGAPPDGCRG